MHVLPGCAPSAWPSGHLSVCDCFCTQFPHLKVQTLSALPRYHSEHGWPCGITQWVKFLTCITYTLLCSIYFQIKLESFLFLLSPSALFSISFPCWTLHQPLPGGHLYSPFTTSLFLIGAKFYTLENTCFKIFRNSSLHSSLIVTHSFISKNGKTILPHTSLSPLHVFLYL